MRSRLTTVRPVKA